MGVQAGAAALGTAGSLIGGAIQGNATSKAAKQQAALDQQAYTQDIAAGNQANTQDQGIYNTEKTNLSPYLSLGNSAAGQLQSRLPALTANFTGANLANTPGYQFTLQQGLEQAQNGFAAKGLASSGAAMKGGEEYATGLAQSTYNQQLQNYLNQNNQIANILGSNATLGANAGVALGNSAAGVGGGAALVDAATGGQSALENAGTARSAGITGSTSQYLSPLTNLTGMANYANLGGLQNYLTPNAFPGGANSVVNSTGQYNPSGNSIYGGNGLTGYLPQTNAQTAASQ